MSSETQSDAGLLEAFATLGEESAFTELVERHGPRVLRVCRRILPNIHDAEEVFQATFLLLARKVGMVSWNGPVDRWLCASARRLALSARAGVCRRQRHERSFITLSSGRSEARGAVLPEKLHPLCNPADEIHRRDQNRLLRGALGQLPEKYRAAVELCYLEGKTNEEAARALGWPTGSMSRRLKRARGLLRHRLVQMGLTLIVLMGCVTCSILAFRPRSRSSRPPPPVACPALYPLRAASTNESDLQAMLKGIDRGGQVAESTEQVDLLARTAGCIAVENAWETADASSPRWLMYAERMRLASLDLSLAARSRDRGAVVESARRLDASCIACHEVFRQ